MQSDTGLVFLHTAAWNESVFRVRYRPARKHPLQERYPIGIVGFYLRASIGLPAGNLLPLCNSYDRIFRAGWIQCHLTVPDHLLLLKHP